MHLPGVDLLVGDVYAALMGGVTDVKDIGNGIVGGVDCDHLAFRTGEVDWPSLIAAGDEPYPCRYAVTSELTVPAPEYRVAINDTLPRAAASPRRRRNALPLGNNADVRKTPLLRDVTDSSVLVASEIETCSWSCLNWNS